jgi:hypothetical protein
MEPELLIKKFPRLYHMADKDAWPSIQRHGLLSTTALLDLFEVNGEQRTALESKHRPECVVIHHPLHGAAVIRDQKPMDDKGLTRCLTGVSPKEWYEILNRRTFFWLTEDRLGRLLSAGAYRHKQHCVLTVDTRVLVERHLDRITLSPRNSGCTKPMPHPRGRDCFLPVPEYPYEAWSRKRHKKDAVVELAVDYSVPDIADMVIEVEARQQGGRSRSILRPVA